MAYNWPNNRSAILDGYTKHIASLWKRAHGPTHKTAVRAARSDIRAICVLKDVKDKSSPGATMHRLCNIDRDFKRRNSEPSLEDFLADVDTIAAQFNV